MGMGESIECGKIIPFPFRFGGMASKGCGCGCCCCCRVCGPGEDDDEENPLPLVFTVPLGEVGLVFGFEVGFGLGGCRCTDGCESGDETPVNSATDACN